MNVANITAPTIPKETHVPIDAPLPCSSTTSSCFTCEPSIETNLPFVFHTHSLIDNGSRGSELNHSTINKI